MLEPLGMDDLGLPLWNGLIELLEVVIQAGMHRALLCSPWTIWHWNWHDPVEWALVEVEVELLDEMGLCLEIGQSLGGLDLRLLLLGH